MYRKRFVFIGLILLLLTLGFSKINLTQEVSASYIDFGETTESGKLYRVMLDEKYGLINSKGEIVLEPIYDGVYIVNASYIYSVLDPTSQKEIYYNSMGEKLFDCPRHTCGVFDNGLALYMEKYQTNEGKSSLRYGYINEKGEVVIEPIYKAAYNFSEGLARVNMGKAAGYINTNGELVIPYRFSSTSEFSEGMAVVSLSVGGKSGYIDTSGNMIVSPQYDYAMPFSDDVAVVYVNGKYGYIDKKGDYILEPQFEMAQPFSEGLAFVQRNGVTFYINKKGEKVIQYIQTGGTFSGGLAPASRGGSFGFIDQSGTFVIKQQFDWANSFQGELAEVTFYSESGTYVDGYIDRNGSILWPPHMIKE